MAAVIQPMASTANLSSQAITSNTTTAASGFAVSADVKEILVAMTIGARTDGTFVNTLQGSIDGTTFVTLKSGSNITAAGTTFISWVTDVDGALPPILRICIVSTGVTTGATACTQNIFLNRR